MHALPLEIQHTIFTLACTDGGRTGLALSLTSKSYRDAVRPVRLHSVAIRAFPHIAGVLRSYKHDEAELAARRSTLKPRVRHLLLSPEPKASYDIYPDELDSEGSEAASDEAYIASLVALLQLVGPTLTTLAYTAQFRFATLASVCPMPVLEECTLFEPLLGRVTKLPGPPHLYLQPRLPVESPASYPALRKLHAIVSWGAAIPSLLGWWAEAAPNVKDVRLTNVGVNDRGGSGGGWVRSMIDNERAKRPYSSVRRLIVEPYPVPSGLACGTSRARWRRFVETLKKLEERAPGDIQYVLKLEEEESEEDTEGEESKEDSEGEESEEDLEPLDRVAEVARYWMDGVNGGPGGWKLPDEEPETC